MGETGRYGRAEDALYLGALLALVALFFVPAWRQPDGMWYAPGATYSDLTITHWPSWWFVRQSLQAYKQIPLWRPAILGGAPFVANPLTALFYLPNWLALLLPLSLSFSVQYALHAFGAGAALYALARWGYGRSPFSAFLGGLGYALTPKWIAHMGAGHVGLCQAYAWLPLIAWALRASSIRSRDFHIARPRVRRTGFSRFLGRQARLKPLLRTDPASSRDTDRRAIPMAPSAPTEATERGMETAATDVAKLLMAPSAPTEATERGMETAATDVAKLLACAAALAMAYLADPRVAFYAAGMAALYALYRLIGAWRQAGWRAALSLSLAFLLIPLAACSLAAVQILPTGALMPLTTRSAITLQEAGRDSLPWRYLLGYLIADRGGYHEWMTYLGLLPLGLSGLALWQARQPERWFWAGLALLALLYALGANAPLFPLLYRLLPALGWVRVPSRALLLVALSVNLLATFGADTLLADQWSLSARRWARRLALAGLLTAAGLGLGFAALYGRETPQALYALAGIGAAACGAWLLSLWLGVPRPLLQGLLCVLLLVDLWPVGRSLVERRSHEQVFAEGADVAAYLSEMMTSGEQSASGAPWRVYSPSYSVPQHAAARLGLEQLDGVEPVQLSWVAGFISLAGGYPLGGYQVTQPPIPPGADVRTAWRDATPDAALLGALNVCAVAAEFPIQAAGLVLETRIEGTYVYRNEGCLPRAYLMTQVQPVEDWQEAQAILEGGFDPAQGALVEGGKALAGRAVEGDAIVREYTPNRIVVEARAAQASLLVLADAWTPGWRVTVDGVERPGHRVNGVARGAYLETGVHTVVWRYRPASLRWGAALTACALLAFAVGAIGMITRCTRLRSRDRPR